jgi:flagellar assembly factor FliW
MKSRSTARQAPAAGEFTISIFSVPSDFAMDITTTRFGSVTIEDEDVLTFVDGLIGMEDCRQWTLLADAQNTALGWLQSLDRPEVALAVVCPRRFVSDYRARVSRRDVEPLGLVEATDAQVLAIVNQVGDSLALNLKAPLVVHVASRLGRQIVAKDNHSVQHLLSGARPFRRTA